MPVPRVLAVIGVLAVFVTGCTSAKTSPDGTTPPSGALAASGPRTPASDRAPPGRYADWSTYHGSTDRSGYAATMPAVRGSMKVATKVSLDGAVYASPIVIKGVTIVATENNTVYAFSPSFKRLWRKHLGAPSPAGQRPCGNVDPLGITGTPAYSASTGLLYVAPEFSGSPPTHQLYALSLNSGAVSFHRTLDLPGVDSRVMQERGALAVHGSRVYVPFGGLAGDCGAYKGRVIAYALTGAGNPASFTVPTAGEAGIWTPPGPTIDAAGNVLVAVGNGASVLGDPYDYSDSVLELSPTLRRTDSFSPSTWAQDNAVDADLGSQGPAVVGRWVFTAGKSGTAYVLSRTRLGGIGGQVSKANVCHSFGGTAVVGSVVYVPCTDGLRAVRIDGAGRMQVLWHADSAITGSPVVGGTCVWSLNPDSGQLYSLDPKTGHADQHISVGTLSRFAAPALYGRNVYVPTMTGFTVVRTS
ncbi:MAG: hypothetical protein ACR2LX_08175 [Jatrophihabitans sp.]